MLFLSFAYTPVYIFCNYIRSERNGSDAKPRKHATKHRAAGKDWVFAPGLPLGPWITEKRKIGHELEYFGCLGKYNRGRLHSL